MKRPKEDQSLQETHLNLGGSHSNGRYTCCITRPQGLEGRTGRAFAPVLRHRHRTIALEGQNQQSKAIGKLVFSENRSRSMPESTKVHWRIQEFLLRMPAQHSRTLPWLSDGLLVSQIHIAIKKPKNCAYLLPLYEP